LNEKKIQQRMDFDGASLDLLDDMDVVDVTNPLDDSRMILDLDGSTNDALNDSSFQQTGNEQIEDDEEEDEEEDDNDSTNEPTASIMGGTEDGFSEVGDQKVVAKGREKSNAKAVECLDLDGNVIEIFKSGLAASTKLNIPQGDISQCCRGLKRSVAGYRFRFHGDTEERVGGELKLKRGYGYVLEPVYPGENKEPASVSAASTRNTRASRGEYSILNAQQMESRSSDGFKAIAAIKVSKIDITSSQTH
jgi:hypothetical protein